MNWIALSQSFILWQICDIDTAICNIDMTSMLEIPKDNQI